MIISISGRMGSGKDTAGKLIQYLFWCQRVAPDMTPELEKFMRVSSPEISGWQIKKWAGPLRKVAAILLGMDEQFLYTDEFKQMVLPDCWATYNTRLSASNFHRVTITKEKYFELLSDEQYAVMRVAMTGRDFLQKLGTDAIRNGLHDGTWVNALMNEYKPIYNPPYAQKTAKCDRVVGGWVVPKSNQIPERFWGTRVSTSTIIWTEEITGPILPDWIITDTRFPNELKAIEDAGGITVQIQRWVPYPESITRSKSITDHETVPFDPSNKMHMDLHIGDLSRNLHESETSLDNAKFDYVIRNDSTIEDLVAKLKTILIDRKIIPQT